MPGRAEKILQQEGEDPGEHPVAGRRDWAEAVGVEEGIESHDDALDDQSPPLDDDLEHSYFCVVVHYRMDCAEEAGEEQVQADGIDSKEYLAACSGPGRWSGLQASRAGRILLCRVGARDSCLVARPGRSGVRTQICNQYLIVASDRRLVEYRRGAGVGGRD